MFNKIDFINQSLVVIFNRNFLTTITN